MTLHCERGCYSARAIIFYEPAKNPVRWLTKFPRDMGGSWRVEVRSWNGSWWGPLYAKNFALRREKGEGEELRSEGKRETTRCGASFSRLCMSFIGSQSYAIFGSTLCILFGAVTAEFLGILCEVECPIAGEYGFFSLVLVCDVGIVCLV